MTAAVQAELDNDGHCVRLNSLDTERTTVLESMPMRPCGHASKLNTWMCGHPNGGHSWTAAVTVLAERPDSKRATVQNQSRNPSQKLASAQAPQPHEARKLRRLQQSINCPAGTLLLATVAKLGVVRPHQIGVPGLSADGSLGATANTSANGYSNSGNNVGPYNCPADNVMVGARFAPETTWTTSKDAA